MPWKLKKPIMKMPKSGWKYSEHNVEFSGEGIEDLIIQVSSFREVNRYPIGDPESDISAFLRKENPGMFFFEDEKQSSVEETNPIELKIREWVEEIRDTGVDIISKTFALERMEACISCDQSFPIHRDDLSYKAAIFASRGCCRGLPEIGCKKHCFDCSVAVSLSVDNLPGKKKCDRWRS